MQKSKNRDTVWLGAVLGALCLPLLALEWNHGHYLMDDGFILAFGWRIWNGEVPYRDFIFHKTPLSLYLHSLWLLLPDNLPYIAARFGFYMQMFVTAFLPSAWAVRSGYVSGKLSSLAVIGILFLFSFHNFPPMPWYTIDANLFSTIELVLLLKSIEGATKRQQATFGLLSAICFVLAFLSKQNYAVLFLLFFGTFSFFAWRRHQSLSTVIPSVVASAITLLVAGLLLVGSGAWIDFVNQLLTLTTASAFREILLPWLIAPLLNWKFWVCALMIAVFALSSTSKLGELRPAVGTGLALIPFALMLYLARLFQHETQIGFWFFWCTTILVLTSTFQLRAKSSPREWTWAVYCWGTLLISFASSISYGWITPMLAAYGPIYAYHLERLAPRGRDHVSLQVFATMVLGFTFSVFVVARQTNLFTEQARSTQTYNLGDIYPRLEGVYSHRQIYEDYLQLNQITAAAAERFQRPVVVMPNFPLFYFLEGKRNSMTVDWWDDGDTVPHMEKLLTELKTKKPLILLQTCYSIYEEGCAEDRDLIPKWVKTHSKVLIETPKFSLVSLD